MGQESRRPRDVGMRGRPVRVADSGSNTTGTARLSGSRQKSWFSPAKIAETDSSEKTLLDRLGEDPGHGQDLQLRRLLEQVDRNGVGDDDALDLAVGELLERSRREAARGSRTRRRPSAPAALSAFAPARSVPPVTIMSSLMIATLPTDVADHLGRGRRVVARPGLVQVGDLALEHLAEAARHLGSTRRPARRRRRCRPESPRSLKYCAKIGSAVMWSTGSLKKPWIWPACRSIVRTRSTPADLEESRPRASR